MRALGNYLVRGRLQAVGVISTLTVVSWFLPPLTYLFSAVPLGLITLRRGAVIGMQVLLGSCVVTALLALAGNINPAIAGAFAVGIWAPVWVCSLVLRLTEAQGLLVMAAGVLGVLFALGTRVAVEDVSQWWQSWFDAWVAANLPPGSQEHSQKLFETVLPYLNAMMGSALVMSLVLSVLIARWWQSWLFNPGGFRVEFHGLRLPRMLAPPTLCAVALLYVDIGTYKPVVTDLVIIVLFLYLFQGIAAVHRGVHARGLSQAWLVGMYGLLFLVPQTVLFMACIGMADSIMGWGVSGGDNNST